ncbi:MAG: trigger factor, partial [bacterium]
KYSMILEAIVAAENIEVTQDDVDAELQDIAAAYAMDLEKVKEILGPQEAGLRRDIANRKAMDLVVENVK